MGTLGHNDQFTPLAHSEQFTLIMPLPQFTNTCILCSNGDCIKRKLKKGRVIGNPPNGLREENVNRKLIFKIQDFQTTNINSWHIFNHQTWPSGKLPFECPKIVKNLIFFQKIAKNCIFPNSQWQYLEKRQFLDNQMAIFRRVSIKLNVWLLPILNVNL